MAETRTSLAPTGADLEPASEMISLLKSIGMPENSAAVLFALSEVQCASSKELQKKCGLRQPEVSVAIKRLTADDMVSRGEIQSGGRGRPRHLYHINGSLIEVVQPYVEDAKIRLQRLEGVISRLDSISEAQS